MKNLFLIILVLIIGCQNTDTSSRHEIIKPIEVKYAQGFALSRTKSGFLLEVIRPYPGAKNGLKYRLTSNESHDRGELKIPVRSMVCTSTSHIPMLEYLNSHKLLAGFPTLDYISSQKTRARIDSITDIGSAQELNIEKLLELDPDVVVNFSMNDLGVTNRLESLGMKVIVNGDYLENHPLGRAEWIKVFGVLTGKLELADSLFSEIEKSYLTAKSLVSKQPNVKVLSGSLYGDVWFMPGGRNYAARLLKDAGYFYVMERDTSYSFLQLGFENVYEQAQDCDYWISPAPFQTLEALGNADQRYRGFSAFKEGKVYTYDNRIGETGGNQFLELGYLRPDIILKDLIKIRDANLLSDHELYFYRRLE